MYSKKTVSPLREKLFALAVRIVKLYQYLVAEKKEFTLSRQILKSGTSPGANIREAFNGESDADFIHKLSVSQKKPTKHSTGWSCFLPPITFQKLNATRFILTPKNY